MMRFASLFSYNRGMQTKAITVRLDPDDYGRLDEEARRLGLSPGTLARVYVRSALSQRHRGPFASNWDGLPAALADLRKMREQLPPIGDIDVVQIIHEGRKESERRLLGWCRQ